MARFDGGRQGIAVWVIGLAVTITLAAAGAIFGSEYNVLERLTCRASRSRRASLTPAPRSRWWPWSSARCWPRCRRQGRRAPPQKVDRVGYRAAPPRARPAPVERDVRRAVGASTRARRERLEVHRRRRGDVLPRRRAGRRARPPAGSRRSPPPPLSMQTISSCDPGAARGQQPADVVPQRDARRSAASRQRRVASAAPSAEDTTPSIPLAPRLARKRMRLSDCGEAGLDVADRHRGADPDERLVGQLALERGDQPWARTSSGDSASAAGHELRPRRARSSSQPGRGCALRISTADASASSVGAAAEARISSAPPRRLVPARRAGRSAPAGGPRARRAAASRWACRPRAARAAGALRGREPLGAQQHVVVGDHVRAVVLAAAHARGRLGQQRPARRGGEPRGRLGELLGGRAADDRPARGGRDPLRERVDVVGVRGARVLAQLRPGPAARRGRPSRRAAGSSGSGASGSRSGKFRCTGPGRPPRGGPLRAAARARGGGPPCRARARGCRPPRTT